MGSRASYYMVRGGELTVSSSKWGAYGVDAALFNGPVSVVRHLFDAPDPSYAYQDEIMCEGGIFLDADARRLRMFGGELIGYEPSLRPAYLGLLHLIWQGWDVDWAHDGICELTALVVHGGPITTDDVDEAALARLQLMDPASLATREPLYDPGLASGESVVLVSFLDGDSGSVDDHVVPCDDAAYLLGLGPDLQHHLGERFRCALPTEEDDLHLRGGAVVDPEQLCVTVWMDKPRLLDFQHLARRWPEWTLQRQDEGLAHHIRQTGRDPAHHCRDAPAAIARILEKLDESRRFREDPAVRAILRGVAEADEPRRLAEHIRLVPAREPRTVLPSR